MSWDNVDNKHKRRYDRNFVSCEEAYEKTSILDTIMEEFPYFNRESVLIYQCSPITSRFWGLSDIKSEIRKATVEPKTKISFVLLSRSVKESSNVLSKIKKFNCSGVSTTI